jgi:hypothetical protein
VAGVALRTAPFQAIASLRVDGGGYPECLVLTLPIHTVSESNMRDHWAVKARRVKEQRARTFTELTEHFGNLPASPVAAEVRLLRVGARALDDDNLRSSLKAVRDGVAEYLGIDDGKRNIKFSYAQEVGKYYAVEIAALLEWQ